MKLPEKRSPIGGWKTKLAAFSCIAYAIGGLYMETHGMDRMIELMIYAIGMLGLGHKIERAGAAYETSMTGNLHDIVAKAQGFSAPIHGTVESQKSRDEVIQQDIDIGFGTIENSPEEQSHDQTSPSSQSRGSYDFDTYD